MVIHNLFVPTLLQDLGSSKLVPDTDPGQALTNPQFEMRWVYIFLFIFLPFNLYAAEFTASVNKSQITMAERLQLKLELKDANPKAEPNISELGHHFSIQGQQQSSSTMIINGRVSKSTSWHYLLTPKQKGQVTLPQIQIESSRGTLRSQPIQITVESVSTQTTAVAQNKVTLSAHVSKRKPYKNEPITYTARLKSPVDLANINLDERSVKDAIVELMGQPKIEYHIENGVPVRVAEIKYLITPLKSGSLTIPPIIDRNIVNY